MPKNIIICCDGTNNEIAGNQTNVLRLFRMLVRDKSQVAFYDAGVGTNADPAAQWPLRRAISKKLDGGIGLSIRENVLDAYRFLVDYYEEGDCIYLFGFSRGAYSVRALAAMIKRCGLLERGHSHLAEYAWSKFSDEDHLGDIGTTFAAVGRIKKIFSRDVEIHFVGVWDTVSSFGWIWDLLTIPDTRKNDIVHHIRHAVSIDERRSCFQQNTFEPVEGQDCLEVWFSGVHADIGGGYPDKEAGLARIALSWIVREAESKGLRIDELQKNEMLSRLGSKTDPDELAVAHDESKKLGWRLLSLLPRRGYSIAKDRRAWSFFNCARRRKIPEDAFIHKTVETRMQEASLKYQPQLPKNYTIVE